MRDRMETLQEATVLEKAVAFALRARVPTNSNHEQ